MGGRRGALLVRELGYIGEAVVKTRSLAYPRILWRALRQPRFAPGTMRLPFGRVRYVDALALRTSYRQIFVERIYDVGALGKAPTILDCGGNIGLSVIAFKRRYPLAHIVTYEADPAIAEMLARNVKALELADVTVVPAAVGASEGLVSFVSNGADGGHVVPSIDDSQPIAEAIRVPAVRLSERINGPVDLLKLDVEGSEFDVIAELCQSGRIAHVKALICEVHGSPAMQPRFAELWEHLSRAGFQLSLRYARVGGDPAAPPFSVTPFAAIPGMYYAVLVYGWRP
jgi:FkbM family methyltransferase